VRNWKALEKIQLTGAKLARPVIAPAAFDVIEGSKKSMNPSMTRNGALGFFRGYFPLNEALSVTAVTLVSFPTFPHLFTMLVGSPDFSWPVGNLR
jgi:hypothetical protein